MSTKKTSRLRKDLTEIPDWMRKKECPHKEKYMSGKRILPKNISGKEKLSDIVKDNFSGLQLGAIG